MGWTGSVSILEERGSIVCIEISACKIQIKIEMKTFFEHEIEMKNDKLIMQNYQCIEIPAAVVVLVVVFAPLLPPPASALIGSCFFHITRRRLDIKHARHPVGACNSPSRCRRASDSRLWSCLQAKKPSSSGKSGQNYGVWMRLKWKHLSVSIVLWWK